MPSDREVLALALPALGALVAEPLYVLGDTAIIGHLGTVPLAGLALAGLLLAEILGFCTFLEYGTTARAARLYGAGEHGLALDAGVQATWLALGLGAILVVAIELVAEPALHAMAGGSTPAAAQGLEWIRIAALGSPFVLVTAAAQGWMRGFQNTRTPLYVIGVANIASVFLSAVLVFGLDMGIRGSAIANVVAQVASGSVFLVLLVRRGAPLTPSWQRIRRQLASARDLGLRTVAFFVAFTVAAAVAARISDAALAAHQIGAQIWFFTALFLDATAIAAQALIGRLLGAGAVDVAHALARRLLWAGAILGVGFAAILAAGYTVIPALFTSDSLGHRPGPCPVAVAGADDAAERLAVRARRRAVRRRRPAVHAQRDRARCARRLPADHPHDGAGRLGAHGHLDRPHDVHRREDGGRGGAVPRAALARRRRVARRRSGLDRLDLLDVPDDPGALGPLGLDDAGLLGKRHLARLAGHAAHLTDGLLLDGGQRHDDPGEDRHVGCLAEVDRMLHAPEVRRRLADPCLSADRERGQRDQHLGG